MCHCHPPLLALLIVHTCGCIHLLTLVLWCVNIFSLLETSGFPKSFFCLLCSCFLEMWVQNCHTNAVVVTLPQWHWCLIVWTFSKLPSNCVRSCNALSHLHNIVHIHVHFLSQWEWDLLVVVLFVLVWWPWEVLLQCPLWHLPLKFLHCHHLIVLRSSFSFSSFSVSQLSFWVLGFLMSDHTQSSSSSSSASSLSMQVLSSSSESWSSNGGPT